MITQHVTDIAVLLQKYEVHNDALVYDLAILVEEAKKTQLIEDYAEILAA